MVIVVSARRIWVPHFFSHYRSQCDRGAPAPLWARLDRLACALCAVYRNLRLAHSARRIACESRESKLPVRSSDLLQASTTGDLAQELDRRLQTGPICHWRTVSGKEL